MSKCLVNVSEFSPKPNVAQSSIYFAVSPKCLGDLTLFLCLSSSYPVHPSWRGDILVFPSSSDGPIGCASLSYTALVFRVCAPLSKCTPLTVPPLRTHHSLTHTLSLNVIYSEFIISANRSKQMVQVIFNFDLLYTWIMAAHHAHQQQPVFIYAHRKREGEWVEIGIGTSVAMRK